MTGDIWATLQQAWTEILDFLAKILSPDWDALILLIPLLLAPLVLLYLALSGGPWTLFGISEAAPAGHAGRWVREPSSATRWVPRSRRSASPSRCAWASSYPPGTARSDDGEDLAVVCPMCRVERRAQVPTCGSCGLVLNVRQGMTVARPAGPPPGGAAIA